VQDISIIVDYLTNMISAWHGPLYKQKGSQDRNKFYSKQLHTAIPNWLSCESALNKFIYTVDSKA